MRIGISTNDGQCVIGSHLVEMVDTTIDLLYARTQVGTDSDSEIFI